MHLVTYLIEALVLGFNGLQQEETLKPLLPSPEGHPPLSSHERNATLETTNIHYPVIMWHGMGDYYDSKSMNRVKDIFESTVPGLFVHSIYVKLDPKDDQAASIWGDAMTEVQVACEEIKNLNIDIEKGINVIGFSQGGLFVRSLAQTCDVKIHNVISVGSPQNGFVDLPPCQNESYLCNKKRELIKGSFYTDYMQNNNIQAQYFRDVYQYERYLEKSAFLKFVNNELFKDLDYYDRFTSIDKFVMVMFGKDETLVPKETAWFYDVDETTGELLPFDQTDSYLNDLIGLRKLHEENKIDFYEIDDLHLKMSDEDLVFLAETYF